jgi:hypothetical protein
MIRLMKTNPKVRLSLTATLFVAFTALLLCTGPLHGHIAAPGSESNPEIVKGVIDLRDWDFERDGPVSLSGEWMFFWNRHIPPKGPLPAESGFIYAPKNWNNFRHKGAPVGGQGFATYHARVLLPESKGCLSVKLLDMSTSFRLYINGALIASAGNPGKSRETTRPAYRPLVAEYTYNSNSLDLRIHVSNYDHWQGGMWEPVFIGSTGSLMAKREQRLVTDAFLCGSIFMIGLYHLSLYRSRKDKEKAYLYFGIFLPSGNGI